MDYSEKLDLMDDDRDIQGFPIEEKVKTTREDIQKALEQFENGLIKCGLNADDVDYDKLCELRQDTWNYFEALMYKGLEKQRFQFSISSDEIKKFLRVSVSSNQKKNLKTFALCRSKTDTITHNRDCGEEGSLGDEI